MKKIKLLFAALAAMVGLGVNAQTDEQYDAALLSITSGDQYRIVAEYNSTPYYLKTNGYLTDDKASAGVFTFTAATVDGGFKATGFKSGKFTNGGDQSNNFSDDNLKRIGTNNQNRDTWEAQVYFLNNEGYYAVRSTNATSASWGASAYWTVVDDNDSDGLPNATYTVNDVPFVWKLENVSVEIAQAEYASARANALSLVGSENISEAESATTAFNNALAAADTKAAGATTKAVVYEAISDLKSAIYTFLSSVVISEEGVELTNLWITNPAPYANGDGWTATNGTRLNDWASNPVTYDSGNQCAEMWNNQGGTFKQTLTSLPAGVYELGAIAVTREGMVSTLSAGEASTPLVTFGNSGVNSRAEANTWFNNGNGVNKLKFQLNENTESLIIGLTTGNEGDAWTLWRSFSLTYMGVPADPFAIYKEQLATAAAGVSEVVEGTIPTAAYTVLNNLVSEKNVTTYTSVEEYEAAIAAIENAIEDAKAMVAPYAAYKLIPANATIAGVAAETINAQNTAVEEATTVEAIEACTAALKAAIAAIDTFDITAFTITNASPYANGDGWTATNGNRLNQWASNPVTYDNGNKNAEMWNNTGASMLYTIKDLPAGNYRLTAIAGTRTNSGSVLKVGDKTIDLVSVGSLNNRTEVGGWFDEGNGVNELFFSLDNAAAELTIGLVAGTSGDAWTLWRSFKLDTFDESIAAGYLAPGFTTLKESAQATHDDAAYANVTGEEKTALEAAIAATPNTVAEYEAAVKALNTAVAAFTAAKTNYDIFAKERALADAISTDIVVAAPTTAENALVQFRALKVAEFNYVATAYPFSATSKIGDFSTWTRTGTVNGNTKNEFEALTSQHWSGTAMTYYEQPAGGWDANAWTANYTKTTTLPAGNYVIKVAARAATGTGTVAKITCADVEAPIFNFGDTGKGITTAGVASFDEGEFANGGNGRGWVWNYLPFTLDAETEVTMTVVAEGKGTHQWFSVCDGELLSKTNIATAVAYDEATTNTIKDVDVANVTMTRNIKEGFNTVVLPFDLTANQVQTVFGTGTEVYAFSENGEENAENITISFNKVVAGTISANVPVLVKATEASAEQVFEGVQVVAPTESAIVTGKNANFVGVFGPTTIGTGHFFIGNGALYKSAGATNIKAFRAYIQLAHPNVPNAVRMFVDGEETETGIENVNVNVSDNDNQAVIYNVAGQRISKMQKGINIVNGKKVLK